MFGSPTLLIRDRLSSPETLTLKFNFFISTSKDLDKRKGSMRDLRVCAFLPSVFLSVLPEPIPIFYRALFFGQDQCRCTSQEADGSEVRHEKTFISHRRSKIDLTPLNFRPSPVSHFRPKKYLLAFLLQEEVHFTYSSSVLILISHAILNSNSNLRFHC